MPIVLNGSRADVESKSDLATFGIDGVLRCVCLEPIEPEDIENMSHRCGRIVKVVLTKPVDWSD